jgi:branched-chain amino acid transport system substrate-binding protein
MTFVSRSVRLLTLTAVTVMTLMGVGRPSLAQDQTIKVAILGPFTGGAAFVGTEQLNFAKLAVADFEEATGIKVELVEVDTELDPAKAVTGVQKVELVEVDTELDPAKAVTGVQKVVSDADVVGIVGPAGSQEVTAVAPILEEAGLVYVSPSATGSSLTENEDKAFFRVVPRDDVQGPTDAEYMANELGVKSVYIVDDQTSYSTGLADEVGNKLTELGATVTRDSIKQGDTDFATLVTKIDGVSPDAVFMPFQFASQAAGIARTMKEQGVEAIVFGGDGVFSVKDFITDAAGATEGSYVSNFAPDLRGVEAAADVVAAYEKEYGSDFSSFGGPAYAATDVVLQAIKIAKDAGEVNRETVLAAVTSINLESSVLGIPIAFDEKGDIKGASFFIFKVEGDKFTQIGSSAPAATDATPEATPAQ